MGGHFFTRHHCGHDKFLVDHPAILIFGNVAFGFFQYFEKAGLDISRPEFTRQLQRARGVLNDLHRLDA